MILVGLLGMPAVYLVVTGRFTKVLNQNPLITSAYLLVFVVGLLVLIGVLRWTLS